MRHGTVTTLRARESERAALTAMGAARELAQQLEQLHARRDERANRRTILEAQRSQLQPQLDELTGRLVALCEREAERQVRAQRLSEAPRPGALPG